MANVDHPRGLQPYGPILRATEYELSTGLAQDLFIFDPVIALSTGYVSIATDTTGNPILGSILAVYDKDKVPLNYWDSGHSGLGYVIVADHPDQLYICQTDGDTSFLTIADQNGNVNLQSATAGSTVNYLSGWEIDDSDTGGNTAGDQIRLLHPDRRPDNTIGIANCDWICRINNHQATAGIVGVGA